MGISAIAFFGAFSAVTVWGLYMAIRGALTDAPPYMQGERGADTRFDKRLNKAA